MSRETNTNFDNLSRRKMAYYFTYKYISDIKQNLIPKVNCGGNRILTYRRFLGARE